MDRKSMRRPVATQFTSRFEQSCEQHTFVTESMQLDKDRVINVQREAASFAGKLWLQL